jgi:hypothetical protein
MTPLIAIALLALMRKSGTFGRALPGSNPDTWGPGRRGTVRRRAPSMPPEPPLPPHPAHVTPEHASPADQASSEHAVHPAHHHASPAEHAAHELPESSLHRQEPPPPEVPVSHLSKPRVVHRRRRKPRVTRLPVQHITASPHDDGIPVTSVANVQGVLRGLGWTGHLTTKGPVIPELKDGLFGQITVDDWEQSANKRGLDPTIVRVNGTTVHVHPDTYSALVAVARSKGAVVGIYFP